MKNKVVAAMVIPALVLGGSAGAATVALQGTVEAEAANITVPANLAEARATIIAQTNTLRAEYGLPALVQSTTLNNSAQDCSNLQATNNLMNHCSLPGGSENVGTGGTYDTIMTVWKNSPGHYDNIMGITATDIGVGYAISANGTPYYTQHFISNPNTHTVPTKMGAIIVAPVVSPAGEAAVTFIPVNWNGNSPISSYTIRAVPTDGGATLTKTVSAAGTHNISGLRGGVSYNVSVAATNAVGAGVYSDSKPVTVVTAPTVSTVTADASTGRKVDLSWTQTSGGADITSTIVTVDGFDTQTFNGPATSHTFEGLTLGTAYTGSVRTVNANGYSATRTFSFNAPLQKPDRPIISVYNGANDTSKVVGWLHGASDGGIPVTSFIVEIRNAKDSSQNRSITVDGSRTDATFTNIPRGGEWSAYVTAVNAVGSSEGFPYEFNVPLVLPSATENVTAQLWDERKVSVNWTASKNTGGEEARYILRIIDSATQNVVHEFPETSELSTQIPTEYTLAGGVYTYEVATVNSVGSSAYTSSSVIIVPLVPYAPSAVNDLAGNLNASGDYTVTWDKPGRINGSAVTSYRADLLKNGQVVATQTVPATTLTATFNSSQMDPYTDYTVKVHASNAYATNAGLTIAFTSAAVTSGAPTNLTGAPTSTGGFISTWDVPTQNGGDADLTYTFTVKNTATNTVIKTGTTKNLNFIINDNVPFNASVTVTVTAMNSNGVQSMPTTVAQNTFVTASEPVDFAADYDAEGTISYSYKAPTTTGSFPVTSYKIVLLDRVGNSLKTVFASTLNGEITVDDLDGGRVYTLIATARSGSGIEGEEATVSFKTPSVASEEVRNQQVTPVAGDPFSVKLTWDTPEFDGGDPITGYEIWTRVADTNDIDSTLVDANIKEFDFSDLDSKTNFEFAIVPITAYGEGKYSWSTYSTPAAAPKSVTNLNVAKDSSVRNGVNVTWSAPIKSEVDTYDVKIYENGALKQSATVSGNITSKKFTVTANVNYVVEVTGVNEAGKSTPTSTSFVGPKAAPTSPIRLGSILTDTGVSFSWQAPLDNGGATVEYYNYVLKENGVTIKDVNLNAVNFNELDLKPLTNYTVIISAVNSEGHSETVSKTVLTDVRTPAAPTNITFTDSSSVDEKNISWDSVTVDPKELPSLSYVVTVKNAAGVTIDTKTVLSTSTKISAPRGASYSVSVVAKVSTKTSPATTKTLIVDATVPDKVVTGSAMLTNATSVKVNWSATPNNGGSSVTGYKVDIVDATTGSVAKTITVNASTLTATLANLNPATSYIAKVTAMNIIGNSEATNVANFMTSVTPASEARNLTVTPDGTNGSNVTLVWDAPTSNGGDNNLTYKVTYVSTVAGSTPTEIRAEGRTAAISGLKPGQSYDFTVVVINSAGNGTTADVRYNTPAVTPDAITILNVAVNPTNTATVAWEAPTFDGGAPIIGYEIRYTVEGSLTPEIVTTTGIERSKTIQLNQPNKNYTFVVAPINAKGMPALNPVSKIIKTNILKATGVTSSITFISNTSIPVVNFTEPTNNGGDSNLTYKVQLLNGTTVVAESGNLKNVTSYAFTNYKTPNVTLTSRVIVTNGAGSTTTTSTGTITTPIVTASVPRDGKIVLNSTTTANISWVAPANTGGSTNINYRIEYIGNGVTKTVNTTATNTVLTGLEANVAYYVTVTAENEAGSSETLDLGGFVAGPTATPNTLTSEQIDALIQAGNTSTLQVVVENGIVKVKTPTAGANDWFYGVLYSTPVALGWSANNAGSVNYAVTEVPFGSHNIVLYKDNGDIFGIGSFTVTKEDIDPGDGTEGGSDNDSDEDIAGGTGTDKDDAAPKPSNTNTDTPSNSATTTNKDSVGGQSNLAKGSDIKKENAVKHSAKTDEELAKTGADISRSIQISVVAGLLLMVGVGIAYRRRPESN